MFKTLFILILLVISICAANADITVIEQVNKYGGETELLTQDYFKHLAAADGLNPNEIENLKIYRDAEGWAVEFEYTASYLNQNYKLCRIYKKKFKNTKIEILLSDSQQLEKEIEWTVSTIDENGKDNFVDQFFTDKHIQKTGEIRTRVSKEGTVNKITYYYTNDFTTNNLIKNNIYYLDESGNIIKKEVFYEPESKDGVIFSSATFDKNGKRQTIISNLSQNKSLESGNESLVLDDQAKTLTEIKTTDAIKKDGVIKRVIYTDENKIEEHVNPEKNGFDKLVIDGEAKTIEFVLNGKVLKTIREPSKQGN